MDNYFKECPAMMSDGRLFTDYRSSQVREELFREQHCLKSENQARAYRIDNGEQLLDNEWLSLKTKNDCHPRKKCFHKAPMTRTTSLYNNAEILAYNSVIPAPQCDFYCNDYRLTKTNGIVNQKCLEKRSPYNGYSIANCPSRCSKN